MPNLPYLVKEKLVIEINVIGYKTEGESSVVFIKNDSKIAFSIVVDCFCCRNMNKTVEILRNNNIKHIDYLCWSHPDNDHSKGMCDIYDEFVNENTIVNIPENVDSAYKKCSNEVKNLFDKLKKESCNSKSNIYTVSDSKDLLFYKNNICFKYDDDYVIDLKMNSFAPNSSLILEQSLYGDFNKNDHSIGFTIKLGEVVLMFTGDMGNTTIAKLPKLYEQLYFLKIPHHGSETSSKMLDVFKSVNVVCSTVYRKGKNNLPSQNIINSYKKKTNNLYITSSDSNPNDNGYGVINISIDVLNDSFQTTLYGDAISVNCSK